MPSTALGGITIDLDVPVALLLDQNLSPAAKLVWMLCRLHATAPPRSATSPLPVPHRLLKAQSGLARSTISAVRAKVATIPVLPGPVTTIPASLLTDPALPAAAKVLYGILQGQNGEFTYPALHRLTGASPTALRRAVAALVEANWLATDRRNRLAPVRFTLHNVAIARQQSEVALAIRRLHHGPSKGEALMKEYLSLLIDSHEFEDNARPGWLVNPKTGERLELDRFYINVAAFEYNGAPHFGADEHAIEQQTRDLIKIGICAQRRIPVVIIHSEDLSLSAMRAKIGQLLPLRDLTGHELLVTFLERAARRYRDDGAN
ncbi:MAG: hypothetical protein ACM3XN_01680 [Chloroflexota bacterium]